MLTLLKGYATPNIYQMIFFFFCSICFLGGLEAFSPQLVNPNMPLDPSNRDQISLSSHKHSPMFRFCFDSGTRKKSLFWSKMLRSLYVPGSQSPEVPEDISHYRDVSAEMGRVFINFKSPTFRNVQTTLHFGSKEWFPLYQNWNNIILRPKI